MLLIAPSATIYYEVDPCGKGSFSLTSLFDSEKRNIFMMVTFIPHVLSKCVILSKHMNNLALKLFLKLFLFAERRRRAGCEPCGGEDAGAGGSIVTPAGGTAGTGN